MPRSYGITNAAPYASAPSVGPAGDTYYNTTSKTLFVSDGTLWVSAGGSVEEVFVGPGDPGAGFELWYDNDAVPPAPSGTAVAPEVFIGPNDPGTTFTLWYDTDATGLVGGTAIGLEATKPTTAPAGSRFFASDTKRDWLYDGTGWIIMREPPQTYVPVYTAITPGNASVLFTYQRSDGFCSFEMYFALGTTSAIGTTPQIGLPFPYDNTGRGAPYLDTTNCMYYDSAGSRRYGRGTASGTQNLLLLADNLATGNYIQGAALTAAIPFAWKTNDRIEIAGNYPMLSIYS